MKEFYHICSYLCYFSMFTNHMLKMMTLKEKGRIRQPIVPLPLNLSLLTGKPKVENMCTSKQNSKQKQLD